MSPARSSATEAAAFRRRLRDRHPRFLPAVLADTMVTSAHRGRSLAGSSRSRVALEALRLAWESDGFAGQVAYRAKARLQGLGIPVLPRLLHRLAIIWSQLYIGDPVHIEPGVHLAHGSIVIDGMVEIETGATIFPFATIGLVAGSVEGPKLARGVTVGSGAKVLGPVRVGERARIGANAVVVDDVPAGATAVGIPARTATARDSSH